MPDQNELERIYDAVTQLASDVRAFMERLVRVETRGDAVHERLARAENEVASLKLDVTAIKTKVGFIVAGASLLGGVIASIGMKLLHL